MVDDQNHYVVYPPDTESQGKIVQVWARLEENHDPAIGKVDGTRPLPTQERLLNVQISGSSIYQLRGYYCVPDDATSNACWSMSLLGPRAFVTSSSHV